MTGAFFVCLALAVASWPSPLPAIFTRQTPATFEFSVLATINPNTPKNQTVFVANGTISLNAQGGLAVGNPIDATVKIDLFPVDISGIPLNVFAVGMTFHPAYSYEYPLASLPKLAEIKLSTNPAKPNEASGSMKVEFFRSGDLGGSFNATRFGALFPNGTALFVSNNFGRSIPNLFQISPPDVAVASDNGAYTIALTWVIIGLSLLTLRKED